MSLKQKQQKRSNDSLAWLRKDKISNLPTCLIVKILSLLPTKDAVVTSALATKWKHLWTSVTSLDLDDKEIYDTIKGKYFESFVTRVLLIRDKSCLQRFRLKSVHYYDGTLVNAWIASVVLSTVKEFDVSVFIKYPVSLPSDMFLCKTLVILKLAASGKVIVPTSISLPNLKTFHLENVELSDDASIVRIFCGCPVLEESKLTRCIGKSVRVIHIISASLTNLTFEWLPYDGEKVPSTPMKYRIVLDTPSLQYFNISDYVAESYVMKDICHVIAASIDLAVSEDDDYGFEFEIHTKAFTELFNAISQVRNLVLSDQSTHLFGLDDFELPEYSNLTCLEILAENSVSFRNLATLLEKSTCVDTLNLRTVSHDKNRLYGISPYYTMPACFHFNFKLIEIEGFRESQDEMQMVEFFLKNANVLEKLILHYQTSKYDYGGKTSLIMKLLMFPKASTACKIEVV